MEGLRSHTGTVISYREAMSTTRVGGMQWDGVWRRPGARPLWQEPWLEPQDCGGGAGRQQLESRERAVRGAGASPEAGKDGEKYAGFFLLLNFSLALVPLISQTSWQRSLGNAVPCGTQRVGHGSENKQMTNSDTIWLMWYLLRENQALSDFWWLASVHVGLHRDIHRPVALQTFSFLVFSLRPLQIHWIPSQPLNTPLGSYDKFWIIFHVLGGRGTGDSMGHPRLALSSAVLPPFQQCYVRPCWGGVVGTVSLGFPREVWCGFPHLSNSPNPVFKNYFYSFQGLALGVERGEGCCGWRHRISFSEYPLIPSTLTLFPRL